VSGPISMQNRKEKRGGIMALDNILLLHAEGKGKKKSNDSAIVSLDWLIVLIRRRKGKGEKKGKRSCTVG